MDKVTCPECGATLFYALIAKVEIKCYRCKAVINLEIKAKSVKHTIIKGRE